MSGDRKSQFHYSNTEIGDVIQALYLVDVETLSQEQDKDALEEAFSILQEKAADRWCGFYRMETKDSGDLVISIAIHNLESTDRRTSE